MTETGGQEGSLGWFRLGCLSAALLVVPIWILLWALFTQDTWIQDDFGVVRIRSSYVVGLIEAGGWVLALIYLAIVAAVALRAVGRTADRISRRREGQRFRDVVGDGAVMRADAWSDAADKMDPDEPEEQEPTP